ncbi:MAG: hypothetical protein RBS39_12450 [Phycisphaerales bacterium]|jgi:hypothetical protein|nr:hypothetical protein [Phycisphaerales bacterium]
MRATITQCAVLVAAMMAATTLAFLADRLGSSVPSRHTRANCPPPTMMRHNNSLSLIATPLTKIPPSEWNSLHLCILYLLTDADRKNIVVDYLYANSTISPMAATHALTLAMSCAGRDYEQELAAVFCVENSINTLLAQTPTDATILILIDKLELLANKVRYNTERSRITLYVVEQCIAKLELILHSQNQSVK